MGITKWIPQPNEGPYRLFYVSEAKYGCTCPAVIDAFDDAELEEDMNLNCAFIIFVVVLSMHLWGLAILNQPGNTSAGGMMWRREMKCWKQKLKYISRAFVAGFFR